MKQEFLIFSFCLFLAGCANQGYQVSKAVNAKAQDEIAAWKVTKDIFTTKCLKGDLDNA